MSSTAISAQGTVLSIGTGTGSAKTIIDIAIGNPSILTSTAHGLHNGDVVVLTDFTGADAASVNGQSFSVRNTTANTFAIYLDTTGKTIVGDDGTATSTTYTAVANIKDFTGFDGSASEIDVPNLDSVAKEFRLGLNDPGQFTFNIDYDGANAGHIALRAKQVSGMVSNFKVVLPSSAAITFNGFVKKFTLAGGVDALAKTAVDIRITGLATGL